MSTNDADSILDELGIKSAGSRDLLTPGIRSLLDAHTREQTIECVKSVIERSRSVDPYQKFIREYDQHRISVTGDRLS